ncbi:hypothetical protein Ciccas_011183 [Cichlidogyrus casuarinus]|uniref:Neurotransmitter-gated ion-channel transmembrane domain-containing protein n=1 Tax=Cichlidogyrus casuarinus TaxID=1844966 RepID=A0ABD2PU19_9PLAT
MRLSQFELTKIETDMKNETFPGRGDFTVLMAKFYLKRNTGYFLLQIYLPCSLLVVMSWVGFWINREATADRIGLGIMTVLTMVFMGMDNKKDLPRVPYSTALDVYVAACFAFILATIIEFACVHYFTKVGFGEYYPFLNTPQETSVLQRRPSFIDKLKYYDDRLWTGCIACITGSVSYRKYKMKKINSQINSVSRIDRASRLFFPLGFITFNVCYWILYLYII